MNSLIILNKEILVTNGLESIVLTPNNGFPNVKNT